MEKRVEEILKTLKELGRELDRTPGKEKEALALAYAIGYLESGARLPAGEKPW